MSKIGLCISFVLACCLFGCGGGGGGGDFIGAAIVSLDASPSTIDTGDRMQVSVNISQVHKSGIDLKFRFPIDLSYVANTSILTVGNDTLDTGPSIKRTSNNDRYLVFEFAYNTFEENSGVLTFELEADAKVSDGVIEVDADVSDATQTFDPENPEFDAEDAVNIAVN